MNNTLLIVGDPRGNHTLAATKRYPAESITVWEHPDNYYTIQQISDKINVVTDDLQTLIDQGMKFDLIIGNPPYSDRSNASASGEGGMSASLDDKFVLECIKVSDDVRLIIRSKHFSKESSNFRRDLFKSGKVKSITYLPGDTFAIQNTETCILHVDQNHTGPTKITYKNGEVRDVQLNESSIVMLKNPDYVSVVPNNMSHRYMTGKLTRNKIKPVDSGIRMVEICGRDEEPQMVTIDPSQDTTGINQHGVVINFSAQWGGLGRIYVKPYDTAISNSIVLLKTDSEEESIKLKNYLETDSVKKLVKDNMASFHPTKSLFKTIPDIK
jgi:hypothetical protein